MHATGRVKRSNCLFFAVALYVRLLIKGDRVYFKFRISDHGPFPHFLVERVRPRTGTLQTVSYKPKHPIEKRFPPPLFDGEVRFGD